MAACLALSPSLGRVVLGERYEVFCDLIQMASNEYNEGKEPTRLQKEVEQFYADIGRNY
jgi:hypothetical protein